MSGTANRYAYDVVLNEDETKIIASRMLVQAYKVLDTEMDKNLMEDMRKMARESGLNATVFHSMYLLFDQVCDNNHLRSFGFVYVAIFLSPSHRSMCIVFCSNRN